QERVFDYVRAGLELGGRKRAAVSCPTENARVRALPRGVLSRTRGARGGDPDRRFLHGRCGEWSRANGRLGWWSRAENHRLRLAADRDDAPRPQSARTALPHAQDVVRDTNRRDPAEYSLQANQIDDRRRGTH